ncbi:MAG: hypothetical protein E4H28_00400 [Gemmatimonadales bacterium]|nr:MAG: hypothetical protein E4H28_00400 [Gemmatimonadales bacterium]
MRTRTHRERSYRRAVAGGVALSIAAHVALLAYGRIAIDSFVDPGRTVRLVQLAEVIERDVPLEVVRIREPKDLTQRAGGSQSSLAAEIPQRVSSPTFSSVSATLTAAIPNPLALLEVLEQEEKPENPVASYANLSDFAVDASSNPRPLRSMDDRPIGVLAALASVGNGSGVTIGGGHCPSPGSFP